MELEVIIFAFVAGILTILAPCVLPLLPVIVGGAASDGNKKRVPIILISLSLSIFLFALVLRASTILIDVPDEFWKAISGGILFILGIFMLIPEAWDWISFKSGLNKKSSEALQNAGGRKGIIGAVLTGSALGPVFLSCSPTYAIIIAIIINGGVAEGVVYLASYVIGFAIVMFAVAIYSFNLINKLKWAVNPHGVFKRVMALIFILVGWSVIFGVDKEIETWITEQIAGTPLDVSQIEENFDIEAE